MVAPATATVLLADGEQIAVSSPDKPLWPEAKLTKLTYLQQLAKLSPYLLTYCRNRHVTTIRYPHGVGGPFFYQKNCPPSAPAYVRIAPLLEIDYICLDSLPTLLWLGNMACLEFHPSLHYVGQTEPVEWMLDIDPSQQREPRLMEATMAAGEALDKLGIRSLAKTSGASGVQLYIRLKPGYTFEQLQRIGRFIGSYLVEKHPRLFTMERLKKHRDGRIYFDYQQHAYGKTIAAPYTPRAKPHATVSTPLEWSEVEAGADPYDFTLMTLPQRLERKGDLLAALPPQNLDPLLALL